MKIKLPQYSGKDYLVMTFFILPFTFIINYLILGPTYYSNGSCFSVASIITCVASCIDFILCGSIAVYLKRKFASDDEIILRLGSMILCFIILTGLFLSFLFRTYAKLTLFHYTFDRTEFVWAYIGMGIANIFLTFLHEGISKYEDWKLHMNENEKLKKANRQSRLQGLKSQVNPHFLFNSLNTLSSLIDEDNEEHAEQFLNELSMVYRYMLKNDDDHLVTLGSELKFTRSYYYILRKRFGEGLKIKIDIPDNAIDMRLPPLALQTIIENAIAENIISRNKPLTMMIRKDQEDLLLIRHNIQPRVIKYTLDEEYGLDNLLHKYELINHSQIIIRETATERNICLPLFMAKEEVLK